jgi:hypothetical protein
MRSHMTGTCAPFYSPYSLGKDLPFPPPPIPLF